MTPRMRQEISPRNIRKSQCRAAQAGMGEATRRGPPARLATVGLLTCALLNIPGPAPAQTPVARADRLMTFADSPGISEVIDINVERNAVGRYEVVNAKRTIFRRTPYLYWREKVLRIPLDPSYTYSEATCLSDRGLVFGSLTRPLGGTTMNPLGFAWDPQTSTVTSLLPPEGGTGSHAMDTSADGLSVVGYVLGSNPPSMSPSIWQRRRDHYEVTVLDTPRAYNPFLQTAGVAISPDGRTVVACAVATHAESAAQAEPASYHTFSWRWNEDGQWHRSLVMERAMRVAAVSNEGLIAGSVRSGNNWKALTWRPGDDQPQWMPTPDGHTESMAAGIGPGDVVVGYSEGRDVPPQSWLWRGAEATALELPVDVHWVIATSVNQRGDVGGYYGPKDSTDTYDSTVSFILREAVSAEPSSR